MGSKAENIYVDCGEHTKLIINSKKYGKVEFLIDTEDVYKVKKYQWHLAQGNATSSGTQGSQLLHRVIIGRDNFLVKRVNGNFDCRKEYLELISLGNRNAKGQYIYKNGKQTYQRIERDGKNLQKHRFLWEQAYGKIPKGHVIHHINGNKKDNRLENLKMLSYKDHNLLHSIDRPIWNKGLTTKNNEKFRTTHKNAVKKRKENYLRKCKTIYYIMENCDITYVSLARILGMNRATASIRYNRYKREVIDNE